MDLVWIRAAVNFYQMKVKPLIRIENKLRRERVLGLVAVLTLLAAWIFGYIQAKADLLPFIDEALPGADHYQEITGNLFKIWGDQAEEELLGYVSFGEASGYGGPMTMAVAVTPEGDVINALVVSHKETPSFMDKVLKARFIEGLLGKSYQDKFQLGKDLDGITGATFTSRGVAQAIMDGSKEAALQLGLPVDPDVKPEILFGIPEILLLFLFGVSYIIRRSKTGSLQTIRWATLIAGMIGLGFIYNSPLTLSHINQLLLGFWPKWQTHLYWYIMIGGILFVYSVDNKNPYCDWFCPFGAVQECLGAIGGARIRATGEYHNFLKWLQRGLAWLSILLALIFRNPGITSYEIFGTLFKLIGSDIQFLLLGLILIAALFIRRPWCTYLCPLHPVDDFFRMFRKWLLNTWKKQKRNT